MYMYIRKFEKKKKKYIMNKYIYIYISISQGTCKVTGAYNLLSTEANARMPLCLLH